MAAAKAKPKLTLRCSITSEAKIFQIFADGKKMLVELPESAALLFAGFVLQNTSFKITQETK